MINKEKPGQAMGKIMIIFMFFLLVGLAALFNYWIEERENPNRHIDASMGEQGQLEIVLSNNHWGHFVASGHINDHPVTFLVDTGATTITVPEHIAQSIGLKKGRKQLYTTANGTITAYATLLTSAGIDALTLKNIEASINPYMKTNEVLLGMSFLKHLVLEHRGDTLKISLPQRQ